MGAVVEKFLFPIFHWAWHIVHWWIILSYYKSFLAHRNKSLICVPMDSPGITLAKKIDKMGMRVSEGDKRRIAKCKSIQTQCNSTQFTLLNITHTAHTVGSNRFCFCSGSFGLLYVCQHSALNKKTSVGQIRQLIRFSVLRYCCHLFWQRPCASKEYYWQARSVITIFPQQWFHSSSL